MDLSSDDGFKIDSIGMDACEISDFITDPILVEKLLPKSSSPSSDDVKEKISKLKEIRKETKDKLQKRDDAEYYVVIVGEDRESIDKFLQKFSFPLDNRFIPLNKFCENLGLIQN
jgi:hypothetical protein